MFHNSGVPCVRPGQRWLHKCVRVETGADSPGRTGDRRTSSGHDTRRRLGRRRIRQLPRVRQRSNTVQQTINHP